MKAVRIITISFLIIAFSITGVLGNIAAIAAPTAGKIDSQNLRWKGKILRIAISNSLTRFSANIKSDSDVLGTVRRSLQAWSEAADIDLQLELSDRQSVSPNGLAGDGVSLITIAQTPENVLFFAKDYDTASAKTRIFYNRKGAITEADIVLNPFQQFSTDGTFGTFDLESTLTHEIGHMLGLHHSEVLCATMAASFARNGTMGFTDLGPRTLSTSDVAAIRELYGAPVGVEDCCAAIGGKLVMAAGRAGKGLEIWVEESGSGRVAGQTDSASDGSFRIGGLPGGSYSVYWKTKDPLSATAMGKLGDIDLEAGERKTINEKISLRPLDVSLQYLGRNGQLANYGMPLTAGRTSVINLGGRNLDIASLKISFSSPLIKLAPNPVVTEEFGHDVSGISFMITVESDIPPGDYSVFVNGKGGPISCLIGALSVE
jgi:hypothetical protein